MTETLYLDFETADADRIWDYGPGFVRLAGLAVNDGAVVVSSNIGAVAELVAAADLVVGHNILGFDLPALERYHGLDLARLVREGRVVDTMILARQADPPLSGKQDARRYGLDAVAKRLGVGGKLAAEGGESALKKLAAKHGGFDKIPVDDPTYRDYLVRDVEVTRAVAKRLPTDAYARREHEVLWRLGHIEREGFRVDVELAQRLVAEQSVRVEQQKRALHERFGLPLEGKKPHTTTAGKLALEQAFLACGVEPPRTAKGSLATGKDALAELEEQHPCNEALHELTGTLRAFNGERSTAQTILDHVHADGRIHPSVDASQATGRISVTKPGLTVMGKRDRKNVLERSMLLPDEGHVLVAFDLSQVDARAMAAHSQDQDYIRALEPGKDMHSEMAAALFGEHGWDRSAGRHPRREDAKAITHATSYGMGAAGLAASTGLTLDEAQQQLAALDASFPRLAAFKRSIREQGKWQLLTNAFGRRLRVQPGREFTQAPAAIGQGTARDLMMQGILRLPEWLLPCLRAIVHDEIVLSVPIERADEAEAAVMDALQFAFRITADAIPVPVLADVSARGRDWADCYRNELSKWPEVARDHREQATCDDGVCTWHMTAAESATAA